jgi:hypothetical protein
MPMTASSFLRISSRSELLGFQINVSFLMNGVIQTALEAAANEACQSIWAKKCRRADICDFSGEKVVQVIL